MWSPNHRANVIAFYMMANIFVNHNLGVNLVQIKMRTPYKESPLYMVGRDPMLAFPCT